jgi:hypothetical protein
MITQELIYYLKDITINTIDSRKETLLYIECYEEGSKAERIDALQFKSTTCRV